MNRRRVLSLLPLVALGCQSGDPASESAPRRQGAAPSPPPRTETIPAPRPTVAAPRPEGPHAKFSSDIAWVAWDEARRSAQEGKRPIFLLVYADWCPHCRTLSAVFDDPEVKRLSKGMVMVRQNADESPPWLDELAGRLGGYVPRVFFVRSDGSLRSDITSGNTRFPYFYTAEGIESLRASMRRASEA